MKSCAISLAGEQLVLLPQKAIYWPRKKTLVVADVHFGKAASFRRLGVPVPSGTTTQNLTALDELIGLFGAQRIVFLGDFLHAPKTASSSLAAMREWRLRHSGLDLTLVRGNHDLHAGDPPAEMEMQIADEPQVDEPFAFCHHPDVDNDRYVLAGHVHPAYLLARRNESYRLPCFVIGQRRAILPSFGAFTGAFTIAQQVDETIFVIADDTVIAIPTLR